ncbi:fimbrial protein [Paraburkholderia sp. Ac-20347]|jgi:major type 1 subunit fimbrin (pilin)|uniref:fimbrial protein n=1 Tax=Paraburkholderia sp. Ac-20347 TaxID=2703892 RepID=UPI00197E6C3E|nr:fimbrial protein [Paraburkholderia sp. Ac-20347]MBN3809447.1 type 1 fimbrial protein [Paraburkholderia sp. Ac-20347]
MNAIKKVLAVAVMAIPMAAFAQTTSVTFTGKVVAETCTATINGSSDATITLPTVATTDLNAAGATAGLTPFTIDLADCTAPSSAAGDQLINVVFNAQNLTTAGNLGNTSDAANVAVQITTDDAGTAVADMSGATGTPGLTLPVGSTSTSATYGARYVAEDGAAGAGAVNAVANYTLEYL